ncbi:Short-chain dehydrogenase [Parapedobacter composti]|uniref:Short-chain dehydrogenase n=2 Tax=Parapedobacter composti TaxID=623281 RepID=A0A1I1H748_9SPHI|nr:Short-chain dehydrogenase [Parapedobacter composti]
MHMDQQRIIIIGATSGIGRALAEIYVRNGWTVGVTGRRKELLDTLVAAHPGRVVAAAFDVTEEADCTDRLEALIAALGGVDVIVISAGGGAMNPPLDYELERATVELNVRAFTRLAVWAYHELSRRGGGQLAAITSVAGTRGSRQAPAYSATKAFQIAYLEGLQQKARNAGGQVRVTDIRPGFVKTKLVAGMPNRFWEADVERAARQIHQGLAGRKRVIYVTKRWRLVAWIYRIAPRWLLERL